MTPSSMLDAWDMSACCLRYQGSPKISVDIPKGVAPGSVAHQNSLS